MSTESGAVKSPPEQMPECPTRAIAFYLPQFHPTPDNDRWWGPGFTEWTNVAACQPRYAGHDQPHRPADLGYYDLRVRATRSAQAALARQYGIEGFCYYHYWFHGKRPLSAVVEAILDDGQPDLPFALCWANERWSRTWDGASHELLIEQTYSVEDDIEHFKHLLPYFRDPRYIRIDGKPLFVVYRVAELPDSRRLAATWRRLAVEAGLGGLHLAGVEAHEVGFNPVENGFDSMIGFLPTKPMPYIGERAFPRIDDEILDYDRTAEWYLANLDRAWPFAPATMPRWDNSARRPLNARIYVNPSPDAFQRWVTAAARAARPLDAKDPSSRFLFVVAWNEWAEGNHLEPDKRFGHRFGQALRSGLEEASGAKAAEPSETAEVARGKYTYTFSSAGSLENVVRLVGDPTGLGELVLDLGAGSAAIADELLLRGWKYRAVEGDPDSAVAIANRGLEVLQADIRNGSALVKEFADSAPGSIAFVLLLDVLEHVADPGALLDSIRTLCSVHGASLVVSVPNVTHFDVAASLLLGRWRYTENGLLDATHLRFFDRRTLRTLLTRSGFAIDEELDFESTSTIEDVAAITSRLPAEAMRTIDTLARVSNPAAFVKQFIWRCHLNGLVPNPAEAEARLIVDARNDTRLKDHGDEDDISAEVISASLRIQSSPRSALEFRAMLELQERVDSADATLRRWIGEVEDRTAWARRLEAERDEMTTWALSLRDENERLRSLDSSQLGKAKHLLRGLRRTIR